MPADFQWLRPEWLYALPLIVALAIILARGKIVRQGLPQKILSDVEAFGVRQPCASRLGMEAPSWLT